MTLMREEIFDQPAALERAWKQNRILVREVARKLTSFKPELVMIAARGSSDNAAIYARYIFEAYASLPVSLAAPSLFTLYRRPPNLKRAWVIGISQSGTSPDIVEVISESAAQGAFTLAITNDPESALAHAASIVMPLHAGSEKSVAATKTYTNELMLMAMLAAELGDDNGLRVGLERLPEAISSALKLEDKITKIAQQPIYHEAKDYLVLGRGYNFPTALEIALKLKESAYIFAEPYSSADFLHGPFALAQKSLPALLVGASGPAVPGLLDLARKLIERGVEITAVGDDQTLLRTATPNGAALPVNLQGIPEALSPIPCVVPGQLLALHLALARNLDPDKPRGLNKVTQTY
ncbi:MAG: SIS domain-containing protein [Chloroflexi bacterium]|uniref:SIS domain-containing protein n=1 Tax=Candidatus Chlorohelix allophototropha TaxID=3003348 RepID=A0A8T7M1R6_9CHLR|nr:SIS domain-containing protein [Chloroflexota bacterium]WJW67910.1 SIS domain-containing protein [Chloroflexota bacterium L227-S17]